MKKLSLKSLNFGANELLQREELKTVFFGGGMKGIGGAFVILVQTSVLYLHVRLPIAAGHAGIKGVGLDHAVAFAKS